MKNVTTNFYEIVNLVLLGKKYLNLLISKSAISTEVVFEKTGKNC